MLQISLLGPLEVRSDDRPVAVPGGKASQLLVRLAIEAGDWLSADRLVDDLWSARAGGTRRNTLQAKVTSLRRAIGDASVIMSGEHGYALAAERTRVDAWTVISDAVTAERLLAAGDDRAAADLCAGALRRYRGDILPTAGDGEWVTPHRTRLEETRVRLFGIQSVARSRLGDVGQVIIELETAVATYPFQEGLWELLITALYRSGRQADALTAYQRIRTRLSDELGLEPGPRLQQLEQRVLNHDRSLDVVARSPARAAHEAGSGPRGGNVPSMAVELVGRAGDVSAVAGLLAANRLVEIIGPGGIGKTAVALAVGRRCPLPDGVGSDGVWLARLETAATPGDVVDSVIAAVNVPGREDALFERLSQTASLVILDNCEHVLDAVATLVVRLLDAAPRLRILCTSQVPLDLDGEALFELRPLGLADAVELFTRRATAQRMARPFVRGQVAVVDLCRSLDGLPLAIELAAARTRTLSVQEITRRIGDRFTVLNDPTSRRPERRRSLKSTIRWSYDLLFPDDQRGLWALATFAGGAPLPAVESVLAALDVPAATAIDVVGRLAGRCLLIVDDGGSIPTSGGSGPEPVTTDRYRLLDSIRAFALEALADAGLTEAAFAAHATWYAQAAATSTEGVRSSRQAAHLSFVRVERSNIDAALAWSVAHDPQGALRIANGFGWAWVVLGDSRGAERILAAVDAAAHTSSIRDRAGALLLAAWIEASTGDLDRAREHIAAATELADSIDDDDLRARGSYYLAYVVSHHGEFDRAMELTERSRALYDGLDRPWDQAANWLFAARAAISAGDRSRGAAAVAEVERWLQVVDDPWLHVRGDAMAGELARIQHRFDDAVRHLARAAESSARLGFQQTEAFQLSSLGRAMCQAGDYENGSVTLDLAVNKAEATGDVRLAALARVHLGRVLRALGQMTRARTVIEAADSWHRAAGGGEQAALGECLLAAMDAVDRVPGAEQRLVVILNDAQRRKDAPVEVFALDALARISAELGNSAVARDLCEAADRRMVDASHFITDTDRCDARVIRQIR